MGAAKTAGKTGRDLTEGSILMTLLTFVGPVIAANLIQQLYTMVDLMVVGQFAGSVGTVGVSTGGEMVDMLTPVATAFGAAGQIYVGQLAGAKQEKRIKDAIGTTITTMILASIVMTVIVVGFNRPILQLLNCPEEGFSEASAYMIITGFGLPFVFGYNAVTGVMRGLGESKWPMIFVGVSAVVNVFLDVFMVAVLNMGASGAAWATIAAQFAAFLAAFIYMYLHKEEFDFELRLSYFRVSLEDLKVILSLGVPQAIRSLFVRFSMLYVNSSVNAYGLVASATNSVGNKLQKFLEVYTSSFSQASSAIIAQDLGAKKHDRASKTVLYSFGICVALSVVAAIVILVWPEYVFGIFTSDAEVQAMGVTYLRILVIHLFLSSLTSTFQAMVIGSGFASFNFAIGIIDGVVCKVGFGLILVYLFDMGVEGWWWGTAFSRLIPGLLCLGYFVSGKWKTRKLLVRNREQEAEDQNLRREPQQAG